MSFSDADRVKWKKVLVTNFMSSDESGEDDGQPVFIVKKLPWRSERVSNFFERLDAAHSSRKTEQASRQTKPRISKGLLSSRPATRGFPAWAVVDTLVQWTFELNDHYTLSFDLSFNHFYFVALIYGYEGLVAVLLQVILYVK